MRRSMLLGLIVVAGALILAGCGDFRERAAEVETRIAAAEDAAEIASQAAAANTARILELQDRVEALERKLNEVLDRPEGA